MAEFRGFWRHPLITFLRIFYRREKHGGGVPTKPTKVPITIYGSRGLWSIILKASVRPPY
jgi:hypothetical protein